MRSSPRGLVVSIARSISSQSSHVASLTIIARREGDEQRDELPGDDSGDLPLLSEVSADGSELEAGDVAESAVGECADAQARHDQQRQTHPAGQPRGRGRRGQDFFLSGIHLVASVDVWAELLVGTKGEERNVGGHCAVEWIEKQKIERACGSRSTSLQPASERKLTLRFGFLGDEHDVSNFTYIRSGTCSI